MKAIYAKRLLKLAAFLDKLPKAKFDFGVIAERGRKPMMEALKAGRQRCGSVACAIGWMPAVFPRSVCWVGEDRDGESLTVKLRTRTMVRSYFGGLLVATNFAAAERFFGLTEYEAEALFNPNDSDNSLGEDATPKQVAASIRRFVKKKQREKSAA